MKVTLQKNLLSWISFLGGEGIPFELIGNTINKDSKIIILDDIIQFKDLLQSSDKKIVFILDEKLKVNFKSNIIKSKSLNYSYETFDITLHSKQKSMSISYTQINNNLIIFYDSRLKELLANGSVVLKKISLSEDFKCQTRESLCRINKNNIRKYKKEIIKMAFFHLNKPLIYLWKYPGFYRNVFNLRIDVDPDVSREDVNLGKIKNTFRQLDEYSECVTFVINFFRRAPNYLFFKEYVKKFDIQSHSFFHCLFPDRLTNEKNFLLADSLLKKNIKNIDGFICPEYFWYDHQADLLEKYNYKYNHSFGFDYSSYSYRPIVNDKIRDYFEVPVSPLVYSKYENAQNLNFRTSILELYEKAITSNINKVHIPCFIYEHPGVVGFRNEIINQIFKVKSNFKNILPITLTKWVLWLNEREKFLNKFSYTFENNNLKLECKNSGSKFSIAVERKNNKQIELMRISNGNKKEFSVKPTESNFNETVYDENSHELSFVKSKSHRKKVIKNYLLFLKYKIKKFYF